MIWIVGVAAFVFGAVFGAWLGKSGAVADEVDRLVQRGAQHLPEGAQQFMAASFCGATWYGTEGRPLDAIWAGQQALRNMAAAVARREEGTR